MPFGYPVAHVWVGAAPSLLAPAARAGVRMEPQQQRRIQTQKAPIPNSDGSQPFPGHGSPSQGQQPQVPDSPGPHIPKLGLNFGEQAELFCLFDFFFFLNFDTF